MNRWIVEENHITRDFGKFDLGVDRLKVRPVLCVQPAPRGPKPYGKRSKHDAADDPDGCPISATQTSPGAKIETVGFSGIG